MGQFFQQRQTSCNILFHQLSLTEELSQQVPGESVSFFFCLFQIFHHLGRVIFGEVSIQRQLGKAVQSIRVAQLCRLLKVVSGLLQIHCCAGSRQVHGA